MLRTHTCGELRIENAGEEVTLAGWLNRRRDHGPLIFVDLRDRYGMTQIAVDATSHPEAHAALSDARAEYVLQITVSVRARPAEARNPELATGDIEVVAEAGTGAQPSQDPADLCRQGRRRGRVGAAALSLYRPASPAHAAQHHAAPSGRQVHA